MKRGMQASVHNGGVTLGVFTQGDMDDLHLASLEILDRTGVFVESDEALDLFVRCRLSGRPRDPHRAHPPARRRRRSSIGATDVPVLRARPQGRRPRRTGQDRLRAVRRRSHGERSRDRRAPPVDQAGRRRHRTGRGRARRARDQQRGGRPRDVHPDNAEIHSLEMAFNNTTKPFGISFLGRRDCELAIEMATIVAGGHDELLERPLLMFVGCPVAPLVLPSILTENFVAGARTNSPIQCTSMGMAGGIDAGDARRDRSRAELRAARFDRARAARESREPVLLRQLDLHDGHALGFVGRGHAGDGALHGRDGVDGALLQRAVVDGGLLGRLEGL